MDMCVAQKFRRVRGPHVEFVYFVFFCWTNEEVFLPEKSMYIMKSKNMKKNNTGESFCFAKLKKIR